MKRMHTMKIRSVQDGFSFGLVVMIMNQLL